MAIAAYERDPFAWTPGQVPVARAVQPAGLSVVTCERCGCRLAAALDGTWHHFRGVPGADARGCRVGCADLAHELV